MAALISAAALLATAGPAQAGAMPAALPAADVVPGTGTETPSLVDGIREPTDAKATPADAAREHLAASESRYRIPQPDRNLRPVQTLRRGADEIVRLQQQHHGVEVLGGQYLVRMENKDGKRVVTGTSGHYATGLTTGTTPKVSKAVAVGRAVTATARQLAGNKLSRNDVAAANDARTPSAAALTGTAGDLVVLPAGTGVLTYRVTVRGANPATGEPVVQLVYIDATAGFPVLQYSAVKTITAPGTAVRGVARQAPATSTPATDPATGDAGATGSGVRLNGDEVVLQLDRYGDRYDMTDHTRATGGTPTVLATWDARGRDVAEVTGRWPAGLTKFSSPTPDFGADATAAGAVDAHWAAGQVYDYYARSHGRDGLDGRGGSVNSLVGVTFFGGPYVNAFWDGQKMVYGGGDDEYKPLSAATDVVGHEMTHGIVERSANLVYAGQSGAMNEAIADYFGNAVDVTVSGTPMDDPDAGLIAEDLCRTLTPRDCAFRDLNDGATIADDFVGVTFGVDNGGVHLNSTIFSGALWDMREKLGAELADKVVYRALTAYLTPLDGFTQGRDAILAAAKDLGVKGRELTTVKRSFEAHGIVTGWEKRLRGDATTLLGTLNITNTGVGAGGGWWAGSKSNDDGSEPYSVYAGRLDGTGTPKLVSPNDGRYHVYATTDGQRVVWAAYGPTSVEILSRPVAGGPITTVLELGVEVQGLRVEGDVITFEALGSRGGRHVAYVRSGDQAPTLVDGGSYSVGTGLPSISDGRIAYAKSYPSQTGFKVGVEVLDLNTGERTLTEQRGEPQGIGQTAITSRYVFWLADENPADDGQVALRRAGVDGTGAVDISAETDDDALIALTLTASEDAVTVNSVLPDTQWRNETLPKLWQFTTDGSRVQRVSCNRGAQIMPAAGTGTQVVWIDGTFGRDDLVTRTRPAGRCR